MSCVITAFPLVSLDGQCNGQNMQSDGSDPENYRATALQQTVEHYFYINMGARSKKKDCLALLVLRLVCVCVCLCVHVSIPMYEYAHM